MYLRLDPHSGVPLGVQIQNGLRFKIVTQQLQAGEQLPSARDLATELRVNFHTVRKAYGDLEAEGVLEFRRGLGTFVASSQRPRATEVRKRVRAHLEALVHDLAGLDLDAAELRALVLAELDRLHPSRHQP